MGRIYIDKDYFRATKRIENIPLSKNAPCIDVYIDGDELTDKELSDLRESIIKDAFVELVEDGAQKIELFYYDSLTNISCQILTVLPVRQKRRN